MSDEQILQLLINHGYNPKNSPARAKTFVAFARSIIAQARAELIAELVPVAVCLKTSQGIYHTFKSEASAEVVEETAKRLRQEFCRLAIIPDQEPTK